MIPDWCIRQLPDDLVKYIPSNLFTHERFVRIKYSHQWFYFKVDSACYAFRCGPAQLFRLVPGKSLGWEPTRHDYQQRPNRTPFGWLSYPIIIQFKPDHVEIHVIYHNLI
jgi:hypothetical protein